MISKSWARLEKTNHGFLGFAQPSALGMREEAHRRWPEGCSERVASKANDPSKLGLAEKSENRSSLLAEFLVCPARFAPRMPPVPTSLYPCSSV
jgi:hypothetical protein